MRELSLNVLDVAQNSLTAGATLIELGLDVDLGRDEFTLTVKDNGCGMDEQTLSRVCDPFYTTRTTRKVGMGISLFKFEAERAGGSFSITSKKGEGTQLSASFKINHIDRLPLGDLGETVISLIQTNPDTDFVVRASCGGKAGELDTREFRQVLEGVSLASPEVIAFIKSYYEENISIIYGGKL